jgi:hypothetical protein
LILQAAIAALLIGGESLGGDPSDDPDFDDPDRLSWAIGLGLLMGMGAALTEVRTISSYHIYDAHIISYHDMICNRVYSLV